MSRNRWSHEEELELIRNISVGGSTSAHATKHSRSESAVDLRLKKIIYENVVSGRPMEQVARLLNFPIDTVRQYFYSYKEFTEKHQIAGTARTAGMIGGKGAINVVQPVQSIPVQSIPIQSVQSVQQSTSHLSFQHPPVQHLTVQNPSQMQYQMYPMSGGAGPTQLVQSAQSKTERKILKAQKKLKQLEIENKFMRMIVENKELVQKMNILIREGKIDKNISKIIKLLS